jgi:pimeloyl-ACP methyl ester carboxylesterase
MIPAWHATTAHEVIADSRVVLFEGAGHFPHLDQPERFAQLLGDFIKR